MLCRVLLMFAVHAGKLADYIGDRLPVLIGMIGCAKPSYRTYNKPPSVEPKVVHAYMRELASDEIVPLIRLSTDCSVIMISGKDCPPANDDTAAQQAAGHISSPINND